MAEQSCFRATRRKYRVAARVTIARLSASSLQPRYGRVIAVCRVVVADSRPLWIAVLVVVHRAATNAREPVPSTSCAVPWYQVK